MNEQDRIKMKKCQDCGKDIKWDMRFSLAPPRRCQECDSKALNERIKKITNSKEKVVLAITLPYKWR